MIESRPAPLVKAEVDLRDFAFMPLDVLRLRDSELAAVPDGEVFRCAVLSWCVSWHQVPAASLPDDDVQLCRLLGFGRDLRGWKRVRDAGGMRGWVLCEDGRLYHPVVAEKAREAWRGKLEQRWRTEAARVKKHNQRHGLEGDTAVLMPDLEAWIEAGCPWGQPLRVPRDKDAVSPRSPRETASKGQGEGQGQGQGDPPNPRKRGSVHEFPPGFDAFWSAYPRKTAKPEAVKAFARLKPDEKLLAVLLAAIARQRVSPQWTKDRGEFIPHPATWLNGRRWEDATGASGPDDDIFAGAR